MTPTPPSQAPDAPPLRFGAMIDAELTAAVARAALPRALRDPVHYALTAGGKRLRPTLVLTSAEACGATPHDALAPAVAVEMIHAFSLVHDDLPAMDDDDLRRGRPTVHVRFGEAAAVLTGDALMSLAFDEVLRAPAAARLARELAAATTAMIAGQTDDTLGVSDDEPLTPADALKRTHTRKTGALLRACCRMGAIAAGAPDDHLDALSRFGNAVGLAYQIVDDLLDVEQSAETAGKRTGKDAALGKATYPGVLGLDGSRAEVKRLEHEAIAAIAAFGKSAEPLRALCRSMSTRVS